MTPPAAVRAASLSPSADASSHVRGTERARANAPARIVFIDLLRFLAAFQMLQGHTIAAVLAPAYRVGKLHALWSAARGLTSVAFLFAAGLSFYITHARDHATGRSGRLRAHKRIARALGLIALGYALHLPLMAAGSTASEVTAAWREFLAVDVLQCIGVSLLLLQALALAARSPLALAASSSALSLALFALTPLAAALSEASLPRWLLGYLTNAPGSLFPLLPWAAHVFAGVGCGALALHVPGPHHPFTGVEQRWRGGAPAARFALFAALLLPVAWALAMEQRYAGVAIHLARLARVVLLCACLALATARLGRLPRWVQALGAETLFLYAFHVLLVYGAGVGLADRIGPRLGPVASLLAALGVVLLSGAAALGYRRLRSGRLPTGPAGNRLAAVDGTR